MDPYVFLFRPNILPNILSLVLLLYSRLYSYVCVGKDLSSRIFRRVLKCVAVGNNDQIKDSDEHVWEYGGRSISRPDEFKTGVQDFCTSRIKALLGVLGAT